MEGKVGQRRLVIAAAVAAGGDLRAMMRDYYRSIGDDRRNGCRCEIDPTPVREATVSGRPGITYGSTGPRRAAPTERTVGYATVIDDQLVLIVASAHDPGGCIDTSEQVVFRTTDLAALVPLLELIVTHTPLSLELFAARSDTRGVFPDGTVAASDGGLDGGRLWFVWEGVRYRIYQPRGLPRADLPAEGLMIGRPVNRPLRLAPTRTGSAFVVLPFDGPRATLYLLVDDVLHLVRPEVVDNAALDAIPTGTGSMLDRILAPR